MTVELAPRGWHRRGPVNAYARGEDMPKATCSIHGCDSPFYCRGWCVKHYSRWRKNGDPNVRTRNVPVDPLTRVLSRVDKSSGCWLWQGPTTRGYGTCVHDGRDEVVHRFVYTRLVGPIPAGMTLDHDCHNADPTCIAAQGCVHRRCCNPAHLTPQTMRANVRASLNSTGSRNAAKTHCPHGHPYSPENTRLYRGRRSCLTCARRRR